MDVAEALEKADMMKQGGKPLGDTAVRVIDTLAAEVRRLEKNYSLAWDEARCAREVLAEWKAQREYENKHNIVPGGCVSSKLEQWCVHYVHAKERHQRIQEAP